LPTVTRRGLIVIPIAVTAILWPSGAGGSEVDPLGSKIERLDAWAYPRLPSVVRQEPATDTPGISKLHFLTELHQPEIYRVTGRMTNAEGEEWLRIDILGRPNGRVGWAPVEALGPPHEIEETLVIRRNALKAILYRGEKRVFSAPVGIGRGKWPTPTGDFYIREGIRLKGKNGVYGSFAFGTSAYSPSLSDWPGGGVIGIHGTNEPDKIPGRISHGCIRMTNSKINRLRRLAGIGTAVEIR
jgi:L,D-transpeptidase catalytic domain